MIENDRCPRCEQCVLGERDHRGRFLCYHCRKVADERAGGEALRLFTPVETIPGQVAIGGVE